MPFSEEFLTHKRRGTQGFSTSTSGGSGGGSTPVLRQVNWLDEITTSMSFSFDQDVLPGSLLLAFSRPSQSANTGCTSRGGSDVWTLVRRVPAVFTSFVFDCWAFHNAPGGATTVTITVGSSQQQRCWIAEITGAATSNAIEDNQGDQDTGGTNPVALDTNLTTLGNNRLLMVGVASDGNDEADLWTAGSPYTKIWLGDDNDPPGEGSDKIAGMYREAATAGSYGATMTLSGGDPPDTHSIIGLAIKPA